MPVDLPNLLIGILAGALPLAVLAWRLQGRVAAQEQELALGRERLATAQLAQDGLTAQLDTEREAFQRLAGRHSELSGETAALRREVELGRDERTRMGQAERDWADERTEKEAELRRLESQRAALMAELREQQDGHQQRLADLQAARDELRAQFAELAGKIFEEREQRFAEASQQRLGQLLDPLKERIQAFEKRVEESYQQEARERFSLSKELERLQQLNLRLGEEATNLTRALKGQKTQGNWGELVLERVLEHAGLERGREYETQVSLKGAEGERFQPDVLIRLPGDKQVVVDAKVSLTAYQQFIAADDEVIRQQALKQHVLSLRSHVKGLSGKDYKRLEGLHSLDFVLLFMPVEAAFSAALQAEPNLFQEAFERNIVIVSPTTLLATLRVIDSLWRQERQSQNAREIAERAGSLYDKFVLFVQDLDEIGSRLQQLDKAYASARNKLCDGRGNLVSRVEQLRLLGARASKSLPAEWLDRALADDTEQLVEE
ncbi:DNA recombination protein RmuC [Pseudomonas schmalbachii]|uniref:DNA recombination protein RmuC n=1 Tax=Pseudomonas schmalbachii TaxID=2816993 RepID=A0ABS3TXE3_9PSED|nr:DNA recombination protein RmuC [Pseudomonas schmalbachii]MBO3277229.1 DNA recombination protein RmuC [Pseudomonas schmalbachii]